MKEVDLVAGNDVHWGYKLEKIEGEIITSLRSKGKNSKEKETTVITLSAEFSPLQ